MGAETDGRPLEIEAKSYSRGGARGCGLAIEWLPDGLICPGKVIASLPWFLRHRYVTRRGEAAWLVPGMHKEQCTVCTLPPRSLSDLGVVGCKLAAAVHFSLSFCPIAPLWGCKSGKNWSRWGRFSLSTPQVRQAPRWLLCWACVATLHPRMGMENANAPPSAMLCDCIK